MNFLFKTITIFLFLFSSANADETGSASIFSFFNGTALENNEVLLDGKYSYYTDEDGSVELILEIGTHQVEIFAKDESGQNLGYSKKSIAIKEGRDTQIIATFNDEGTTPKVEIDTPVGQSGLVIVDESEHTGTIHGLVLTSDNNLPIINARVFVKGTTIDTKTDENGNFYVNVPADMKLSISIVHSEYSAQTINDIKVAKDDTINREIKLTPASMELEEFIVLAPKVKGSIASIMAEEKNTNAITNIIGSDQMSKKGDSDAASALKRVTGVTLVDGKNIYVRGLGDRYSSIEMNSMPLPSPDPLKRSVPLDIFPSGVINSMKVQKSATPDIPSNFGGGYVDIRTKDSSKDDYVKLTVGVKGNSNTGKDSLTYQGSSTDWQGFDDGYRAIDSSILNESKIVVGQPQKQFVTEVKIGNTIIREGYTKDEISQFTQNYIGDREYAVRSQKLPLGGSAAIEAAVNFQPADKHKITLFGNYQYKQEHKSREEEIAKYSMKYLSNSELSDQPTQYGTAVKSYSDYSQAGIFNIGYNYADVFKIKYTKLYTHNGTQVTKLTHGAFGSNQGEIYSFYDLQWEERTLNADQISGNFDYAILGEESNFRFGAESTSATLSQPNNYRYYYLESSASINGAPFMSNQSSNHVATNLQSEDDLTAFYLKNKFHFNLLSEDDYIDIGYSSSEKTRISKQNKYFLQYQNTATTPVNTYTDGVDTIYDDYVRDDIDYNDRNFILQTLSAPKDYFDADVSEANFYVSTFLKPINNLEVLFGARQVDVTQTTYQYTLDSTNPDMTQRTNVIRNSNDLVVDDIYPSAAVKYKINKNNVFDFTYSKTYIMPDLREASDGIYSHPYDIADIEGNPNLVYTDIYSYDLQFSHYFSDTENVKFGLFYKDLDKPIEDVMKPTSSLPIYSYDNANRATIIGFEIDGRKKLNFINSKLKNFYVMGNFSYSDSDVTLREEQENTYTNNHRQLQGLSQTVLNIALSYEKTDKSATLSYNKMGERIRKVGMIEDQGLTSEANYPDYYEDPAAILDFAWIHKLNYGLSYKIKIGNILDEKTIWYQGDKSYVTNSFKKGRDYSFSVSYKY